jgi:hypothetical protein
MKVLVSMIAAAALMGGVVFVAKERSADGAASAMSPLQMMHDTRSSPRQELMDRSVVFEQAPDRETRR